jgi:hypothetical protein
MFSRKRVTPITPNVVRELHGFAPGSSTGGAGEWKKRDSEIVEILPNGERRVRFMPASARDTPAAMSLLCGKLHTGLGGRPCSCAPAGGYLVAHLLATLLFPSHSFKWRATSAWNAWSRQVEESALADLSAQLPSTSRQLIKSAALARKGPPVLFKSDPVSVRGVPESVLAWSFDMVDHEDFDWSSGRGEPQTQLLDGLEDSRAVLVVRRVGPGGREIGGARKVSKARREGVWRKLQVNLEAAGDAGAVDHGAVEDEAEQAGGIRE